MVFSALQRIRTGIIADNHGNLRIGDRFIVNGIHYGLQVCAAAGYQNCQSQHRLTSLSLRDESPQTACMGGICGNL